MNHLHEVLEQFNEDAQLLSVGQRAICFGMPSPSDLAGIKWQSELFRLPFDVCWFEGLWRVSYSNNPNVIVQQTIGLIAAKAQDSHDFGAIVLYRQPKTHIWVDWGYINCRAGAMEYGIRETEPSLPSDTINHVQRTAEWLGIFLTLLNCVNIKRTEHSPSEPLQKARRKRGKAPLFSYWTLELPLERSPTSNVLGGTHASPRLHLRRGHSREHHPGRWCWVNPHTVGNKKLGIVHKDYAMRAQEPA